jgi:ribosomal protein S18 acetylase RimI-like enzyme
MTGNEIKIITPVPEEAEGVFNVIKQSWYETYINNEIGVTKEDIDALHADEQEQGGVHTLRERYKNVRSDEVELVAKINETIIGVIRLVMHEKEIELRTLYVAPQYFGKGVGTKLWNEGLKRLPSGLPIYVEVVTYTKAVNFYKKMGFVDTGERYIKEDSVMPVSGTKMPFMRMRTER